MADNRNPEAAWTYHDATKHSYLSVRANPHFLDWGNQPLPFKIYRTLELLPLPGEMRQTGVAALSAISESTPAEIGAVPDLEAVAQLCYSPLAPRDTGSTPAARFTFVPPPARVHCTRLNSISCATTCPTCRPEFIISLLLILPCADCVRAIIATSSSKLRAANLPSLTHR